MIIHSRKYGHVCDDCWVQFILIMPITCLMKCSPFIFCLLSSYLSIGLPFLFLINEIMNNCLAMFLKSDVNFSFFFFQKLGVCAVCNLT